MRSQTESENLKSREHDPINDLRQKKKEEEEKRSPKEMSEAKRKKQL